MNFNSVNYMIFLPVVAAVFFLIPKRYRNGYLLAVNCYFYYCNEVRFFLLLPALTVITWHFGKAIDKAEDKKRTALLWASLFANIGTLIFFKYNRFFLGQITALTGAQFDLSKWLLPMGISFYVFMAASYLIDVYMKKYPAQESLVKLGVYITFFPHILMGPIDRADKFIPQLDVEHKFQYTRVRTALQLMALGFFKKIAVADILAMFINAIHNDLYSYTGLVLLLTAVLYSFQLYADFSGYCDIARGSAMIMGFEIAENFRVPYLAHNVTQFWRRWHISLSNWFTDYIYIPLGGSRKGAVRTYVNLFIVFVISGIWHGATVNFVIWGALNGVYNVVHRLLFGKKEMENRRLAKEGKLPKENPLTAFIKIAGNFTLITFAWIFFRCSDVPASVYYIKNLFGDLSLSTFALSVYNGVKTGFDATPLLIYAYIAYTILVVMVLVFMDCYRNFALKNDCLTKGLDRQKPVIRWLCYYVLIAFIMAGFIMNNGGFGVSASFIYNNF